MKKVMALNIEEQALLTEYAELKAAEKELAKRIEDRGAQIMGLFYKFEVDEISTSLGKFTREARKAWKYPADVNTLIDLADKAKTEAQQKGTATYEAKEYPKFYAVKASKNSA